MDVRSSFHSNLALVLAAILFLEPIVATASQLAVDNSAGGKTSLGHAANGVPLINIDTANGNGLSHNRFQHYNVDPQGLILNNATGRTQATELGGIILGNPNLQGQAARIILNEVTGSNPSHLRGYTEVAGQAARVIVANPHGITCNGCGFINTPRATLSTGRPLIEQGRLSRFDVDGGQIDIEGAGLNASNIEQFELITRSARLNAELHARQLTVIAGRNEVDAETLAATAKAADGKHRPSIAIDSSALGGMYAGAIRLVGTEAGVGVKLAGDLAASAGDISIDAAGKLTLARTISSGDLKLTGQDIELQGQAYAAKAVEITARDQMKIDQGLAAAGDIRLKAEHLSNAGIVEAGVKPDNGRVDANLSVETRQLRNAGTLLANRQLHVQASEHLNNQGGTLSGRALAEVTAARVDNRQGRVLTEQNLHLKSEVLDNSAGLLQSQGAAEITARQALDNRNGSIGSASQLKLVGGAIDNRDTGLISSGELLDADVASLDNRNGEVSAKRGLKLKADSVKVADKGLISSASNLALDAGHVEIGQQGEVSAVADMTLRARQWQQHGGYLLGRADISLDLRGGSLDNRGGLIAAQGQLALGNLASLDNRAGRLSAQKRVVIDAGQVDNRDRGLIGSAGSLLLEARRLDSSNQGEVSAGDELHLKLEQLVQHHGRLLAQGALRAEVAGQVDNRGGTLHGKQGVHLTAGDIDNRARGLINSDGLLVLAANRLDSSDQGEVSARGDLRMRLSHLIQQQGRLVSERRLRLDLGQGTLDNRAGTIHARQGLELQAGRIDNRDKGLINSAGTLTLVASSLDSSRGGELSAAADMTLQLRQLTQQDGRLIGAGNVSLDLQGGVLDNQAGLLKAGKQLQLRQIGTLTNAGGEVSSSGDLAVSGAHLNNADGGRVIAAGQLALDLDTLDNAREGLLSGWAGVRIKGASLDNRDQGTVSSRDGELELTLQTLDNSRAGALVSKGTQRIRSDSLNNSDKGVISSEDDIELHVAGTLDNARQGTINASHLRLQVDQTLNQGGLIRARASLQLVGTSLDNSAGSLGAAGALNARLSGVLRNNQAGEFSSGGPLLLKLGSLDNRHGQIASQGLLQLFARAVENGAGTLAAEGDLELSLKGNLANQSGGLIYSRQGTLAIRAASLNNDSGTLQASKQLTGSIEQSISNSGGRLLSESGDLELSASHLRNGNDGLLAATLGSIRLVLGKLFDNSGGVTQANQDVAVSTSDEGRVRNVGGHLSALTGNTNIQTAEFVNQRGGLYAGRHLQVLARTFSNQGDSAGQGGKVSARIIDFSLRDALNNTHGLIEAGDRFHIGATTVDNRQGALRALGRSGESQLISTGVLDNRDGLVEVANGDFKLTPHSLLNAKGSIVHLGSGSFGLASSTLVRAGGTMFTNGALDIEAASWEHSGVVQARELSLRVASFRQSADGRLLATRRLSATGTDWHNDGLIASDGSLDLTLDGGYGGSGRLASQGDLTIKVASLDLARTASVVGGSLSRVTVTGHAVNRGQLLSSGDFTLRAAVLQNQGTLGSSQRLAIHAPQLRNERGLIFSGSDMLLRSHEVSNQRGNFYSLGELELAADDRAARARRFENDSGSVESAGDMRILADTIFNRRADFTSEKSLVSGTFNVYWDDHCKGKGCELYFRSVENYEDRISGDQDSPPAFITAGGHLNLHASRVDNLYSVISAGRDITVTAESLRNVGMAGGEQRHYNAGLYTRDRTIYRNFINSKNQFNRYNDPGSEHYRPGEIRVADVRATAPPGAYFSETSYSVPTSGAVVAPAIIQAGGVVNITATERIENSAVRERVVDAGRIGTQRTDVETTGSATSRAITAQLPPELAQRQVDPLRLPGFSLPSELDSLFRLNSRGSQEAYQPAPQLTSRPSDNRQLDAPEPGSSVGNTPQVQQVQRVTEVPAGHKSPNAHRYLVETNPALTQLKTFLSSDYLLSQLGYDPALAQKRLGDGLYEQHLIRQAVVERTGHRYLAGRHSDEAMFRHLMDNAIASRNRLGLSLGVALTAEQVAALTHDLVWLEEREVQGERVLVPVLYLAQAQGRLVANGALVQGSDLNLISGNALENIGTLRASGNLNARADNVLNSGLMEAGERLRLLATDSIRNTQGGIISGRDVGLTALKGDVINERSVTTVRVAGGGDRLRDDLANNEARIESTGKLSLRAGRDIRNTGSTLLAGGDAQLRAGRNLLIASQAEVDTYEYRRKREHGYDNRVTQHTATVEVGGNLNLDARQDVGVIASKIKTAGDMNLNAGRDLAITSAANEQHRYSHRKQGDSTTTRQNDEVRQQRSQLEAGGDARLSAEGDLLMVASELRAGKDAYLAAGKDIALLAANDETYVLYQKQSKSRFARNSFQRDEATQVRAQGTSVKAEGDVAITSKGDQTYQAAQLQSGQDLTLESGGQIVFEAVKDLDQQSREKSKGNLAWQSAKGRGQTDETLRQSQLAAQGEIAIKAVQGLRIDLRQVDAQTVRQSIDAMVEADPRLAWIKVAEQRGDVDWRQVKEIHDSFKYRNSGLGPGASLVVAITTVALVGPAAKAAFGTLGGAFATSQVTTATVGLINNKGDLSAALKEAFSSDSLKSAAVAAVTAGLTENLYDGMLKTKTNTINDKVIVDLSTVEGVGRFAGNQVLQGATSTALNRALGRDVQLKDALTDALLNTLAAASFNLVGDFAQGKFTDGSPQKVALHALVGGLLSATTGGDFVTGALAAGANEALVDRLNTLVKNNEVLLTMASQLVGVTTAALLDGDMENAAWVNRNATQYNYLNHAEAEERLQKHQACEGGDRQACNRRDELDRLRDERNVALKRACNSGPTSTLCQNLRAQALAARDSFEPHRNSEAWRAAHNKLIENDPEGYLKYSLHQEQRSITEVLAQTPETTPRAQAVARLITDFTPAGTAQALVEAEDPLDVAIALASSNPISKGTLEILKKARGLYKQGKVKEADELLAEAGRRSAKTTRAVASSVGKPTVELFGGQKAQTPGAINVDIRPDIQSGVRADATKLPFRDNSLGEVVASNPFIPKTVGGTNSMMDFLPEATRVVEPDGKIFINANAANPYGKIPSASELESLGLRVIQSGPLDSRFSGQKFLRTDGSVITNLDSMKTVVLEKIK